MWRAYTSRAQWTAEDVRIGFTELVSFGDKTNPRYRMEVEFVFSVDSERYVVPRSMPMTYANRDAANNDTLRFRTGSTHRILYNKVRPYEILLDAGSATQFYAIPLVLTAIGAVLGVGLVLSYLRAGGYFCTACGAGVDERHAFCFHCGRRMPKRKGKMMA